MKVRLGRHLIGTLAIAATVACTPNDSAPRGSEAPSTEAPSTEAPGAPSARARDNEPETAMTDPGDASSVTTEPMPARPPDAMPGFTAASNEPKQAVLAERLRPDPEPPAPPLADPGEVAEYKARIKAQAERNKDDQAAASNTRGKEAPVGASNQTGGPHVATKQQAMTYAQNASITNSDLSVRVYFATKPERGIWVNQHLAPNSTQEFYCGDQECLFSIRTGGSPIIKYKLKPTERYEIKWYVHEGLWDLRWVKD